MQNKVPKLEKRGWDAELEQREDNVSTIQNKFSNFFLQNFS
tara:strand:- start:124 stop:246 length:123 start_codon:yes stop_codon:yes gene_type:complete